MPFTAPIGGLREFVEEDSEEEEAPAASSAVSAAPLLEDVGDAKAVEDSSQNVSLDVSVTTIFSAEGWSAKEQAEKEAREQGAEASAEEIRQAVSEVTCENYAVPTAERLSAEGSADVTGVKAEPEDEKMSDALTMLSIRPEPSESPVELPTAPDQQTMMARTLSCHPV